MIALCVTLVAALVVGGSPPVGVASPESAPASTAMDARDEAARGEALFAEGRFDEASAAYGRAYALDPFPPFLFARARSEQEAGRCADAIDLYREFIATGPPAPDVDRANMEIGRCYPETRTADPPAPRVEPSARAPADAPPAEPRTRPRPNPRWIHDPVGGGVLGAGLVVLATGLGLFFAGDAAGHKAADAATTDDFRPKIRHARALEGTGIAAMSVGSALLVAAITRFAVVARKHKRARAR